MRKLLIFCLFFGSKGFAQTDSRDNSIAISVVIPEKLEGLSTTQISKLETKLRSIISNYGIGGSGYSTNFVVYPKFEIYDNSTVEGGIQKLTLVNVEFSLFIKQIDKNLIFGSCNIVLQGSGKDLEVALNNAIQQIPVKDPKFSEFISSSRLKIIEYYNLNCPNFLSQARSYTTANEFERSLSLLFEIPNEVNCYQEVNNLIMETYLKWANNNCKKGIHEAQTLIAAQKYIEALNVLSKVDPNTNCENELKLTIDQIGIKVDQKQMKEFNENMARYNDAIELEKFRLSMVQEISISYFHRTQPTYNYMMIVD